MNHRVPDFETEEDYAFAASSSLTRPKKSSMANEDIMELLWQNGQVVMQSQNQRSGGGRKPETTPSTTAKEIRSGVVEDVTTPSNLFMQEDEMASWLHYPIDDSSLDLYLYNNDLLYSAPPVAAMTPPPPPSVTVPSPRPPIPPMKRVEVEPSQPKPYANFSHFSRPSKGIRIIESAPLSSNKMSQAVTQSTVVESNARPATEALESRASRVTEGTAAVGGARTSSVGREQETFELSTTSSPGTGGSGESASVEPSFQKPAPPADDRKRKGRHPDNIECYSEDGEFEYGDAKKQSHGSKSTKRSRAAEVHNLSERKRRDRINEKMKALQELIPRCNKSDKASMLDEAIEYLKSLQMQVQMMAMGYGVVPMMFPGVQQYIPPMAMGMGMGMEVNRGMVPYPTVLPGPMLPNSLGQRFPVPGFHVPAVPVPGPAQTQTPNVSDAMMNPFPPPNPNQPRVPNFADPYQQHDGLHQTQFPLPQNQSTMPPVSSKPSSNKDVRNPQRHQTG